MDPTLGSLILVFIGISTACLAYLHFLPTGLRPLRNAVSEYGAGPYKFWYQAMCVTQAAAAFLTAAALAVKVTPAPVTTDFSLIVLGLARLVISQAPVYKIRGKRAPTTGLHMLMALLIFGAAVTASASFSHYTAGNSEWQNIKPALHIFRWGIAIFALTTFAAVIVPQWLRYLGSAERLLYISIIGWFLTVGIHLL